MLLSETGCLCKNRATAGRFLLSLRLPGILSSHASQPVCAILMNSIGALTRIYGSAFRFPLLCQEWTPLWAPPQTDLSLLDLSSLDSLPSKLSEVLFMLLRASEAPCDRIPSRSRSLVWNRQSLQRLFGWSEALAVRSTMTYVLFQALRRHCTSCLSCNVLGQQARLATILSCILIALMPRYHWVMWEETVQEAQWWQPSWHMNGYNKKPECFSFEYAVFANTIISQKFLSYITLTKTKS